jgi:hypothetical protein
VPSPLLNKQVTREKQRAFPPTVLLAKFEKAAGNLRPPPLSSTNLPQNCYIQLYRVVRCRF